MDSLVLFSLLPACPFPGSVVSPLDSSTLQFSIPPLLYLLLPYLLVGSWFTLFPKQWTTTFFFLSPCALYPSQFAFLRLFALLFSPGFGFCFGNWHGWFILAGGWIGTLIWFPLLFDCWDIVICIFAFAHPSSPFSLWVPPLFGFPQFALVDSPTPTFAFTLWFGSLILLLRFKTSVLHTATCLHLALALAPFAVTLCPFWLYLPLSFTLRPPLRFTV